MEPPLLLIGLDRDAIAHLDLVVGQLGLGSEAVETAGKALELTSLRRFRLVVCRYPLPDLTMADMVRAIRRQASPCRDTPLLVLTMPGLQEEARQQVGRGPFLVASLNDPVAVLLTILGQLLRLEPRRTLDLPARLTVETGGDRRLLEGRVVNVSLSGMLVDQVPLVPVATRCRFELAVAGSSVCGLAEVVRHSRPRRERVLGFALRFLSFDQEGRERLASRIRAEA